MQPPCYIIHYTHGTDGAVCADHLDDACDDDRVDAVTPYHTDAPCDWCDAYKAAQDAAHGDLSR